MADSIEEWIKFTKHEVYIHDFEKQHKQKRKFWYLYEEMSEKGYNLHEKIKRDTIEFSCID